VQKREYRCQIRRLFVQCKGKALHHLMAEAILNDFGVLCITANRGLVPGIIHDPFTQTGFSLGGVYKLLNAGTKGSGNLKGDCVSNQPVSSSLSKVSDEIGVDAHGPCHFSRR
jgi:hypothetical protein